MYCKGIANILLGSILIEYSAAYSLKACALILIALPTACSFISETIITEEVDPILLEACQAQKIKFDAANQAWLASYAHEQRAITEKQAINDAKTFYNTTLASLSAKALERAKRKVAEYKSRLKVEAEERKERYRVDLEN